jgi:hypothetical protein
MVPIISHVSNCFDGVSKAYIYIWYSKKWRVVYVGQTNDIRGTLGRAISHVQENGTLRMRFEDTVGEALELADDLIMISFPLPSEREFISLETSYREAVEFLVQTELQKIRGNFVLDFP